MVCSDEVSLRLWSNAAHELDARRASAMAAYRT